MLPLKSKNQYIPKLLFTASDCFGFSVAEEAICDLFSTTMNKDTCFHIVTLLSATGEIRRAVYRETEVAVEVCREDELRNALAEGRDPITVGFKKRDVVAYSADISVSAP